eukprot:547371-Alexandrium_andersonii.AAC.1
MPLARPRPGGYCHTDPPTSTSSARGRRLLGGPGGGSPPQRYRASNRSKTFEAGRKALQTA